MSLYNVSNILHDAALKMFFIYHIALAKNWDKAQIKGLYDGGTLSTEGFIHCSTQDQLVEVANYLFKDVLGLKLLVIDPSKVKSGVRYEEATNKKRYPHIYGPLNIDAVIEVKDFLPKEDGTFEFPG